MSIDTPTVSLGAFFAISLTRRACPFLDLPRGRQFSGAVTFWTGGQVVFARVRNQNFLRGVYRCRGPRLVLMRQLQGFSMPSTNNRNEDTSNENGKI